MTYKNTDVIEEFLSFNSDRKIKTKHLFFEDDVLFSYGYHFPLCIRLKNDFIVNLRGYSKTTATHKGHLIRALTREDNFKDFEKAKEKGEYPDIVLLDTKEIKEIITDNKEKFRFLTIEDLRKLKILKNL